MTTPVAQTDEEYEKRMQVFMDELCDAGENSREGLRRGIRKTIGEFVELKPGVRNILDKKFGGDYTQRVIEGSEPLTEKFMSKMGFITGGTNLLLRIKRLTPEGYCNLHKQAYGEKPELIPFMGGGVSVGIESALLDYALDSP